MVEAALTAGEDPLERRGPVAAGRRPPRGKGVGADVGGGDQVPACLGPLRLHVAVLAAALAVEDRPTAARGGRVEVALRRLRRRDRKLVEVERRQLGCDEVGPVARMSEVVACGDRELVGVVEPVVVEVPPPVHLEIGDEGVPVRHAAPTRVRRQVDARETERRRDQSRRRATVRPERLAVEEQRSVELARAPARQHLVHSRLVHPQQVGERLLVRGEPDDRAHVQVPVRPPIETTPDARSEGVIDSRMAQRTGDPHRGQTSPAAEETLDADNGVQLQQGKRHLWVVEVDLPGPDRGSGRLRDRRSVDLEADRQGGLRADTGTDATVLLAGYRTMKLQCAAPERLITKGVVTEDAPPSREERTVVLAVAGISRGAGGLPSLADRSQRDVRDHDGEVENKRGCNQHRQLAERSTDQRISPPWS